MKQKKTLLFGIVLLLISSLSFAQTNFSGKWTIDTGKTIFGQLPKFVLPRVLTVTQTPAGMIVDRTSLANDGSEKHYMQQMTFDGKTSQTVSAAGNNETDSVGWTPDKTGVILDMKSISPASDPVATIVESWTLAGGGNTLIIDRQVHQPNGLKYEIKGYFNKD